jgi:hypothetical protein
MATEADTCRQYVLPNLYAAGWTDDQISEQRTFTDGRIIVASWLRRLGVIRLSGIRARSALHAT